MFSRAESFGESKRFSRAIGFWRSVQLYFFDRTDSPVVVIGPHSTRYQRSVSTGLPSLSLIRATYLTNFRKARSRGHSVSIEFVDCTVPRSAPMTITRSARVTASSMLCVVDTTVWSVCIQMSSSCACKRSYVRASTLPNGPSIRRISKSTASARAIPPTVFVAIVHGLPLE